MKEYKYPLPKRQVYSGEARLGEPSDEITYVSLKDMRIEKESVVGTATFDEAHYMQHPTLEEHRAALEASMRLPSHMLVSRESDVSRAYRKFFDPADIDIRKYLFLFEDSYADELKALQIRRVEKKREPIPYVPPVDESFLKEIAKQVWASVLPENRK